MKKIYFTLLATGVFSLFGACSNNLKDDPRIQKKEDCATVYLTSAHNSELLAQTETRNLPQDIGCTSCADVAYCKVRIVELETQIAGIEQELNSFEEGSVNWSQTQIRRNSFKQCKNGIENILNHLVDAANAYSYKVQCESSFSKN